MKLAGSQEYRITYWEGGKKYCYRMSTNNIEDYRKTLKDTYNRFTVEEV